MFFIAFGLTGLGFTIAWTTDSIAGFHAIMSVFLIPLWLLSGAVFPITGVPSWLYVVMLVNPLTYSMSALRHIFTNGWMAGNEVFSFTVSIAVIFVFSLFVFIASLIVVKRTT